MTQKNDGSGRSPKSLEDFGRKLESAREQEKARRVWKRDFDAPPQTGVGLAFRIAVELVSALFVGAGIGWGLDEWLGTRPWLMLVFLILGSAAGMLNVYRLSMAASNKAPPVEKADDEGNGPEGA